MPFIILTATSSGFLCRQRMAGLLCVTMVLGFPGWAAAAWKDDIGHARLAEILGNELPQGTGVPISLVESPCSAGSQCGPEGAFFPDTSYVEFTAGDDPVGNSVDWKNGSGIGIPLPAESSNHATNSVGRLFFGNNYSIAPAANDVTVFEANDYLDNVLGVQNNQAPAEPSYAVQNHSWAHTFSSDSQNLSILQRLDYVIDTYDVTTAVGINNNDTFIPTRLHPKLLSYSYNAIAVGTSAGDHSRGVTDSLYGSGRYRPDIVAPLDQTSNATPVVSAAATLLHEELAGTSGVKSETVRALLLAGATKEKFTDFVDPATSIANPWERTPTQPLDDLFGAGELNIFNSYLMTQSGTSQGQYAGGTVTPTTVGAHGWDYQPALSPGGELLYDFVIPTGSTAPELSVVLAWNVEVTDTNAGTPFIPQDQPLVDLNLELKDSDGVTLDESISADYSLEHLYLTDLTPGTYTLKVSSDASNLVARDFGLAWRMSTLFDNPTADFNGNGSVDGADFLAWQRGYGTLVDAQSSIGDADGDGDVDADDLAIFATGFGTAPQLLPAFAVHAVPEPGSALLAGLGILALQSLTRRRVTRSTPANH